MGIASILMISPWAQCLSWFSYWWHNRDYGVFVANPFGREAMKQGERSSIAPEPGQSMTLRFGAYLHEAGISKDRHCFSLRFC
jgi:hypothetical protein